MKSASNTLRVAVLASATLITLLLAACAGEPGAKAGFRTAKVDRGSVSVSISATGTLRALSTVDVGSQVSGQVLSVEVDYNDRVRKGQLMAVLDPQTQRSAVEQSQAAVAASSAGITRSRLAANPPPVTCDIAWVWVWAANARHALA